MHYPTLNVTITQTEGYQFLIDFGDALPKLQADEMAPIGKGEGPCPEQMLVAGVTNCLCASLIFALAKFRQDARGISATASYKIERNERGRLRIARLDVAIRLGANAADLPNLDRALAQFEDFCTVSESVQGGIPVNVSIADGAGTELSWTPQLTYAS
jgi:uncharacterized OsmC-like protein